MVTRKHFDFKGKRILEKLVFEAPYRLGIEFPNEACYVYVRDGHLVVNSIDLKTTLSAKDGVMLNCGYYFADFVNKSLQEKTEVLAIHLYPDVLREIFRSDVPAFLKGNRELPLPSKTVNNTIMEKFIDSLLFYFDNPQIVTEDILVLKVRELILLLVQSAHFENIQQLFTALFNPKTATVSEIVNAHLYENFSLKELAKFAGISLTSFKGEFTSLYGESPARYIRKKKIERAKELLQVSSYSISEIAYQVGFNDLSHFSKSFHASCGQSPGAFRNENFKK